MNSASQREVNRLNEGRLPGVVPADKDVDAWREAQIELAKHAIVANCYLSNQVGLSRTHTPVVLLAAPDWG
jgi:hypothetical protein